ncbi:MAG: FAD-dependent oxidoreductase [Nevskia sp.]|nr:FAD-dependent oxidoreductase [Nevskia sp.]
MNAKRSDVVVLGGGVIGLACALYLLRAGRSVTVLEGKTVGSGSSHGNCGTITPSHLPLPAPGTVIKGLKWMLKRDAPLYVRPRFDPALLAWLLRFAGRCNARDFEDTTRVKTELLLRSRALLEQLVQDEQLQCEFDRSGTLYVYRDAQAFAQSQAEAALLRTVGVEVETLDGIAVQAREPALNTSIVGAHFHPGDARLRPNRYVAELARAVRLAGGVIEEQARIEGFTVDAGTLQTVQTTRGSFSGAEVVFALGAWSPQVGAQLGLKLPIQPGKGYSITYSRPALAPVIPMVLKECNVCVTAWGSGYRLGSTMEFSGYDSTLNRTRLDALARGAAEYLQQPVGPEVEEEWYGWRPMTYDDLPILGRAPAYRNLTLATGHGMLGVSLSAVTGLLISELLSGRTPSLDMAPYAATRF